MRSIASVTLAVTLASFSFACTSELGDGPTDDVEVDDELDTVNLDDTFKSAADEFGVPVEILQSIGYVESQWTMVEGESHHDRPAAYGIMGLRGDDLEHAAALAGIDPDDARYDEEGNIRAAAALLAEHARDAGITGDDLGAWAEAVGRYSGIEDDDARSAYVIFDVYDVLVNGAEMMAEDGSVVARLDANPGVVPMYPPAGVLYASTADYRAAIWRPSPNNSARPGGTAGKVSAVIIHTCEGGYAGCWGWLRNTRAGASAHYVVKENGREITQLVREYRKAWHIAATYSCSRNGGKMCSRNGQSSNNFTIGIEHGGYASQRSFPSGQIEASAKLVCDITRDHGVSRDKYHIVGHGQLQPWNRTDPGRNWPWTHYINRVKAHCGSGGGGGGGGGGSTGSSIVVDSNQARNNASIAKVVVPSSWAASNGAGYYGTGYWWVSTKPVSDGVEFRFYLSANAAKTIDAWWVAGSNRSSAAPFVAFNAAGQVVGKATRSQRTNGSKWNELGRWNFTKGWNKIVVSRWAAEGSVVVADAIRVR